MVKNESKNFIHTTRRIGNTVYKVKVFFKDEGNETMEDKILRIIQGDLLENKEICDIIDVPQVSRQSERSAV